MRRSSVPRWNAGDLISEGHLNKMVHEINRLMRITAGGRISVTNIGGVVGVTAKRSISLETKFGLVGVGKIITTAGEAVTETFTEATITETGSISFGISPDDDIEFFMTFATGFYLESDFVVALQLEAGVSEFFVMTPGHFRIMARIINNSIAQQTTALNPSGSGMSIGEATVIRGTGITTDGRPKFEDIASVDPLKVGTAMQHGGILVDSVVHADWVGHSTALISSVECQSNAFLGT